MWSAVQSDRRDYSRRRWRNPAEAWEGIAGTGERDAGDAAILLHAANEIVDRVELEFRPDPGDHGDIEVLP